MLNKVGDVDFTLKSNTFWSNFSCTLLMNILTMLLFYVSFVCECWSCSIYFHSKTSLDFFFFFVWLTKENRCNVVWWKPSAGPAIYEKKLISKTNKQTNIKIPEIFLTKSFARTWRCCRCCIGRKWSASESYGNL